MTEHEQTPGNPEDSNRDFWAIVDDQVNTTGGMGNVDPNYRLEFEVNQESVSAILGVINEGHSLTESIQQLMEAGITAENLLREGRALQPRAIEGGAKLPFTIDRLLPVVDPRNNPAFIPGGEEGELDKIQRIDVAMLAEHKAGVELFSEVNECTPDVAANALLQMGGLVRGVLHNDGFVVASSEDGRETVMALYERMDDVPERYEDEPPAGEENAD